MLRRYFVVLHGFGANFGGQGAIGGHRGAFEFKNWGIVSFCADVVCARS